MKENLDMLNADVTSFRGNDREVELKFCNYVIDQEPFLPSMPSS